MYFFFEGASPTKSKEKSRIFRYGLDFLEYNVESNKGGEGAVRPPPPMHVTVNKANTVLDNIKI